MIPVCEPYIGQDEIRNVTECVRTGWISNGKYINEFEDIWAKYCGKNYGVAVSNGTVALQLALRCLEFPPGSEVIIPSFTIISCALAATYNGLKPVFVDADLRTRCINTELIEESITDKTRAIMPVHMYGHPANMGEILRIAKEYDLVVIEDAAQAHGAQFCDSDGLWHMCGSMGDISCFSFYNNKIITCGEGGMVLTDSEDLYKKLCSLRNLCFGNGIDRFTHTGLGFNFRMTNMQAAIGVAQVDRIDETLHLKRRIAYLYREFLDIDKIGHPIQEDWAKNVFWMYGILVQDPIGLASYLLKEGIETRPFFTGLHKQSCFVSDKKLPVTEFLTERGLYLPSGTRLKDSQIAHISNLIREAVS